MAEKSKQQKVIYVAGPFRARTSQEVRINIDKAKARAKEWIHKGWAPICIHGIIDHLWGVEKANTYDPTVDQPIVEYNLALLSKCDAVAVDKRQISKGVQEEIKFAEENGIEIIYE